MSISICVIWRTFFLFLFVCLSTQQACSTLPLSVSSLNICEDSNCRTSETAQLRLGLSKGSSECVKIDSTGTQVLPSIFNITVVDSVLSYPLVNCYFSDDPTIDFEGFCGCPGGTSVSCDNCPANNASGTTSICTAGLHNSKGCFLGGAGTWCAKLGFSGVNRFKICDIGDPELQISFKYFDTQTNKLHTVTNPNVVVLANNIFNLTILNPIIGDKQKPEFLVWDLNQNENFYLVPERFVNDESSYDPHLLGWFKTNRSHQVTTRFFDATNIQVSSCSANELKMGISATYFSDFLTNNPNYCAQRVSPGAILKDPGFGSVSSSQGEEVINTDDIIQGKYFSSTSGDIFAVGLDSSNTAYPEVNWWAIGWTIDTNTGSTTGDFICSNSTIIWQQADLTTAIFTCQLASNTAIWGPCIVQMFPAPATTDYICTDIQFAAVGWPNEGVQTWTFNRTFIKTSNEPLKVVERSDSLLIPIKNGFVDLLLEFKNVTFTFDTINAIPHIDSIEESGDDILVVASSKTVPGNCVLMISDDLGPTVSVFLALVNNKYRIPLIAKRFHGEAVITLQCFKNKDAVSFKVDIEKQEAEINERTINSTSVRAASMNEPSVWSKFIKSAIKTEDFIGGIMSTLFSITGNKIGDFFLGIFIIIAVIAAVPLLLYILYKVMMYIYYMIKNRRNKAKSTDDGLRRILKKNN